MATGALAWAALALLLAAGGARAQDEADDAVGQFLSERAARQALPPSVQPSVQTSVPPAAQHAEQQAVPRASAAFGASAALPASVEAALRAARMPAGSVTALVVDASGQQPARLAWQTQAQVNPASIMKLVTTYAALDSLGPAYTWRTNVYLSGPVRDGVLQGDLVIEGGGDPQLVVEKLWLLMRRVQGLGIRAIAGDIVLDHNAFALPPHDAAAFDGEPLRPYNASPDALLINYKSLVMTFVPQPASAGAPGYAAVHYEPPLAGLQLPARVPLAPTQPCGDWRTGLQADISAAGVSVAGSYPAACGEQSWAVAYPDPASYAARAVLGIWQGLGGTLGGQVRDGRVPPGLAPVLGAASPTLAEVIRDVNKYSNNVMAQHVFLALSLPQPAASGARPGFAASFDLSRLALQRWWQARLPGVPVPEPDNGAGLSRAARLSADGLGHLLQLAYRSPYAAEYIASLPIVGVDGTMRRNRSGVTGHLKTGTLRDASGVAGYVQGDSGRHYVVIMIANDPNAPAVRPATDALLEWAARDLAVP
ncbi:MAG: D-alanyl-D-alanine carboxypeptidase/D-alanyl-D-alanine-endopeptidase [Comamonas sp.]